MQEKYEKSEKERAARTTETTEAVEETVEEAVEEDISMSECSAGQKCNQGVKVSDLFKRNPGNSVPTQDCSNSKVQNNQELYNTLSRSMLELCNDMRQFRTKSEGLDRVLFGMQQGVNKGFSALTEKTNTLEGELTKLTELWNSAVATAQDAPKVVNEKGKAQTPHSVASNEGTPSVVTS